MRGRAPPVETFRNHGSTTEIAKRTRVLSTRMGFAFARISYKLRQSNNSVYQTATAYNFQGARTCTNSSRYSIAKIRCTKWPSAVLELSRYIMQGCVLVYAPVAPSIKTPLHSRRLLTLKNSRCPNYGGRRARGSGRFFSFVVKCMRVLSSFTIERMSF